MTTLLVPCDPLTPARPDEHFAPEAEAAAAAGWNVVLVDFNDDMRFCFAVEGTAIYRGWMLTTQEYADFNVKCASKKIDLLTHPTMYMRAHELPGWIRPLHDLTPATKWNENFETLRRKMGSGPAILRDYVKSEKHYWHEACFIPDVANEEHATDVARNFRALRDDSFTGGYVLRRYEPFVGPEARLWCRYGSVRLITSHPGTPDEVAYPPPDFTARVEEALVVAGLDFVTVDVTERADGQWRVVEVGDGQVSDRPSSCDPDDFFEAIS